MEQDGIIFSPSGRVGDRYPFPLDALKLRGGNRKSKGHRAFLKLADMDISRDQSKRWQKEASVPDKDFQRYLTGTCDLGQELTAAGLLRLANRLMTSPTSSGRSEASHQSKLAAYSEPKQLVTEMKNHRRLLADVLRPIYGGGKLTFERGERRVVGQLLREMDDLLQQLEKLVD